MVAGSSVAHDCRHQRVDAVDRRAPACPSARAPRRRPRSGRRYGRTRGRPLRATTAVAPSSSRASSCSSAARTPRGCARVIPRRRAIGVHAAPQAVDRGAHRGRMVREVVVHLDAARLAAQFQAPSHVLEARERLAPRARAQRPRVRRRRSRRAHSTGCVRPAASTRRVRSSGCRAARRSRAVRRVRAMRRAPPCGRRSAPPRSSSRARERAPGSSSRALTTSRPLAGTVRTR